MAKDIVLFISGSFCGGRGLLRHAAKCRERNHVLMENQYFNEALRNFAQDFAYGGAIRHLVDLGYAPVQLYLYCPLKEDNDILL